MSYKLTYFDIPGRGEPARLIFSAAGVKFEDERIQFEDWPGLKSKLGNGQLPILTVNEKTLTQSVTIYRYLGRSLNLSPKDDWESAKCDELVDGICDLVAELIGFTKREPDPEKKKVRKQTFVSQTLPTFLSRLNTIISGNGGQWLIGKSMTWADIVIAECINQLIVGCELNGKILDEYSLVKKLQDSVYANPGIEQYRRNK